MNAKEAKALRTKINEQTATLEIEDFDFVGFTSEGSAFENEDGDSLVIRTIVKAEGTDIHALVAEFTAKQKAIEDKAKAKAEKVAKAKAKEKEEKEG